jgi:Protein of unknown function (DUF3489)
MTKLSDTQAVILSAAAQRADGAVLPLPETLKIKRGALAKVLDSLRKRGLIRVTGADGEPERVVITSEGMAAIGVQLEGDEAAAGGTEADTGATTAVPGAVGEGQAGAADAACVAAPAKRKASRKKAIKAAPARPSGKPTPRTGTKQAKMIEMLKRPEGATVEQIAAATGWRHHTIRGAISGALKKKLGLTVEATRTREVDPNQTGARGSSTVYRITGSGTETSIVSGTATP